MARRALHGRPVTTTGELPASGDVAPDFRLTKSDLSDVTLADSGGMSKILNIVPSTDPAVCAASARRFCEANGIDRVVTLWQLRDRSFGRDYGVEIADGALSGLLARAVIVLDGNDRVVHTRLVGEIPQEPDYPAALSAPR